jgi:hypothetical protein
MQCAFCERPLICDDCGLEHRPPDVEAYRALSMGEEEILCPGCGRTLVCHWCKAPYDGSPPDEGQGGPAGLAAG